MLTVCSILLGLIMIWNLVTFIIFLARRKSGAEKREKARTGFVISSAFLISAIALYIALLIIVSIFSGPIFHM